MRQTLKDIANSFLRITGKIVNIARYRFQFFHDDREMIRPDGKNNADDDNRDGRGEIKNGLRKYKRVLHEIHAVLTREILQGQFSIFPLVKLRYVGWGTNFRNKTNKKLYPSKKN